MSKKNIQTGEGVDRRDFLKGAALVGAGAFSAGALAACAPSAPTSDGGGSASSGAPATAAGPYAGTITPEDWLGSPPQIADADISETGDFDLVVLGGGHAGSQAALAAAQAGASVAVVESQPKEAFLCFGDDLCSYNSQFMIGKGYGPYNVGEIVSEFVRRGGGRVSAPIIKLFVENSGEMLDNMVSLIPETSNMLDLDSFQCIIQHAYGKESGSDYPLLIGGYKSWATTLQTIGTSNANPVDGRTGISRLTEFEIYARLEAEKLGAQWYFEHKATVLATEGDAVTGAIVEKPDGTYLKLNASKGVLLACGDFSANVDMVYNLLGDVNEWGVRVGEDRAEMIGNGRDGVGQKLGCWAGGAIEPSPRPSMNGGMPPGPWGTAPFLMLNGDGKRFLDETMAQVATAAELRQRPSFIGVITDSQFMETVKLSGVDHGAPNWGAPEVLYAAEKEMNATPVGPDGGSVSMVSIINVGMMSPEVAAASGYVAPAITGEDAAEPAADESAGSPPDGEGEGGGMPGFGGPNVWAGNTLEEMLGYIGYEGEALENAKKSIERYNELCYKGVDDDFGKDAEVMIPVDTPPFYGSKGANPGTTSAGLVSLTGLLTDENLNVLKADRSGPIKGLYAAGNCLGQRYGITYSTPSAGNSMGMAMTHGRLAGKIIAAL
ncbi:MAG: FAD-binding protein [Coriobacteriales bacterium]|nr:FAD-binding protein [Coriobacteriales bacterium]